MRHPRFILSFLLLVVYSTINAKEGMWIPLLAENYNYTDLKSNGFKLSPEDIYSINQSCLKDAVVNFGGKCTGEIISSNGLLLTNYHCGRNDVQRLSSVENNYVREGFWAMDNSEEKPVSGLYVSLLVELREFTDSVLSSVDNSISYSEQAPAIWARINQLEKNIEDTSEYKASIESFYYGNQYYLFLYQEYTDIRLVGAPPMSIGNFGGDTDNWIWPRHTGDFSIFRIYADKDGKPAHYSVDNIPYKPKNHLSVSLKGVQEGDFTMVMGYPASTSEYLYSRELQFISEQLYPTSIRLREGQINIIEQQKKQSEEIFLKYNARQKQISNAFKKWQGVLYGFERFDVVKNKKEYEAWLLANAGVYKENLQDIFNLFEDTYIGYEPYSYAVNLLNESISNISAYSLYRSMPFDISNPMVDTLHESKLEEFKARGINLFRSQDQNTEKLLTKYLLSSYFDLADEEIVPERFNKKTDVSDVRTFINNVYESSVLCDSNAFYKAIDKARKGNFKLLVNDPFIQFFSDIESVIQEQLAGNYRYYNLQLQNLYQEYMGLILKIDTLRAIYPEANFTLRLTSGKVEGYSPGDAIDYSYQTNLSGIMQKSNQDVEDYVVPEKLKSLYLDSDFGEYANPDGTMPVCFIASNHTSGGNSGSPVMDSSGNLIGINFDRNWEGTMSDFHFDERICRNISVDIRYVLFVIDKFAGAGYLLDEMDIVR